MGIDFQRDEGDAGDAQTATADSEFIKWLHSPPSGVAARAEGGGPPSEIVAIVDCDTLLLDVHSLALGVLRSLSSNKITQDAMICFRGRDPLHGVASVTSHFLPAYYGDEVIRAAAAAEAAETDEEEKEEEEKVAVGAATTQSPSADVSCWRGLTEEESAGSDGAAAAVAIAAAVDVGLSTAVKELFLARMRRYGQTCKPHFEGISLLRRLGALGATKIELVSFYPQLVHSAALMTAVQGIPLPICIVDAHNWARKVPPAIASEPQHDCRLRDSSPPRYFVLSGGDEFSDMCARHGEGYGAKGVMQRCAR
eukprot:GHVU01192953.1.p1 GENE.GHVU01192953.1~~GHVU01192953.1.p1  ORF type:complete len:310 (-),score=49.57 GHVU01192953.1:2569-3498(-)